MIEANAMREILASFNDQGTTANAVYSALRHCIIEGEFRPGERLLSDDLAGRLGVSRTPVREALRKLEAEGYVVAATGKGLIVREFSEKELDDLFFIREILEGAAARLAAENVTPAELVQMEELLEDMELAKTRENMDVFRTLTGKFHALFHSASRNDRLASMLREIQDSVRQVGSSTIFSGRVSEALKEHRALYNAFKARDSDKAEELAREHRRRTLVARREMIRSRARGEIDEGGKPRSKTRRGSA
jgi:DNA-binding GntR family transcriptional regulator